MRNSRAPSESVALRVDDENDEHDDDDGKLRQSDTGQHRLSFFAPVYRLKISHDARR
jgi:hypothetical protein